MLNVSVFSDAVTDDATHIYRIITLTLGATFLANYTTAEARKAPLRKLFLASIELLMPCIASAAEPVLA